MPRASAVVADRCSRHPKYFLASCGGCQAAQAVRIQAIREDLGIGAAR